MAKEIHSSTPASLHAYLHASPRTGPEQLPRQAVPLPCVPLSYGCHHTPPVRLHPVERLMLRLMKVRNSAQVRVCVRGRGKKTGLCVHVCVCADNSHGNAPQRSNLKLSPTSSSGPCGPAPLPLTLTTPLLRNATWQRPASQPCRTPAINICAPPTPHPPYSHVQVWRGVSYP